MAGARQTRAAAPAPQPADLGDDRSYYGGRECADAIRAMLGRDGYIAWLRGTLLPYIWRLGDKPGVDPSEDAAKIGWYQEELARVLADTEA